MTDYSSPAPMSLSQPHHHAGGGADLSTNSDNDSSDHATPPRPTTSAKSLRRPISSSSPPPPPSSEQPRKPRGRPPGSKNKPKPAVVITKDPAEGAMKPVVLEISAGADIVDSVLGFSTRRRVGLTLLSATGSVSNVTLRHPLTHAPAISLHGPFSLLSLNGTIMASFASEAPPTFGICLAGAQGQVFGGIVGGKVVAASTVVVTAATFVNPTFHRVAGEELEPEEDSHHHHHNHHQDSKPSAGAAEVGSASGSATPYSGSSSAAVASPTPINCQVACPDQHHAHGHHHHHHVVMPSWGHSTRSPY